ncbi:MAG: menaquinone biosynthesis protein [Prevotellaceae bacterium]|jgi:chorismate dehydratase|nr:menaquinone biosynthesis protein [Prevotellaceae bacterium]
MAKVKVTAVSYLNTLPFLYGLRRSGVADAIDLSIATPAACAQQLETGQTDLSLIPVAAIPGHPHYQIIGDYCIGAAGKVRSVALFSNCTLPGLKTVYLDAESRTSILLARILARDCWKITPTFKPLTAEPLKAGEGCVLIGDKALLHESRFTCRYDLAETWVNHTGSPFVFATWTANKSLPASFIEQFNRALDYGIQHIPQSLAEPPQHGDARALPCPHDTALEYLTKNISYPFDAEKKNGLTKFWNLINDFPL